MSVQSTEPSAPRAEMAPNVQALLGSIRTPEDAAAAEQEFASLEEGCFVRRRDLAHDLSAFFNVMQDAKRCDKYKTLELSAIEGVEGTAESMAVLDCLLESAALKAAIRQPNMTRMLLQKMHELEELMEVPVRRAPLPLAKIRSSIGQYTEAMQLFDMALQQQAARGPLSSPAEVAAFMDAKSARALTRAHLKDAGALDDIADAVTAFRRTLQTPGAELATVYTTKAQVLDILGRGDEAVTAYKSAVKIFNDLRSPQAIATVQALVMLLLKAKRTEDAAVEFDTQHAVVAALAGPGHPAVQQLAAMAAAVRNGAIVYVPPKDAKAPVDEDEGDENDEPPAQIVTQLIVKKAAVAAATPAAPSPQTDGETAARPQSVTGSPPKIAPAEAASKQSEGVSLLPAPQPSHAPVATSTPRKASRLPAPKAAKPTPTKAGAAAGGPVAAAAAASTAVGKSASPAKHLAAPSRLPRPSEAKRVPASATASAASKAASLTIAAAIAAVAATTKIVPSGSAGSAVALALAADAAPPPMRQYRTVSGRPQSAGGSTSAGGGGGGAADWGTYRGKASAHTVETRGVPAGYGTVRVSRGGSSSSSSSSSSGFGGVGSLSVAKPRLSSGGSMIGSSGSGAALSMGPAQYVLALQYQQYQLQQLQAQQLRFANAYFGGMGGGAYLPMPSAPLPPMAMGWWA